MQTLLALLATALACAVARPPAVTHAPPPLPQEPQRQRAPMIPPREFLMEYIIPRVMVPQYLGYDEKLHIPRPLKNTFLDREIEALTQIEDQDMEQSPYEPEFARWNRMDSPTRNLGQAVNPIVAEEQMYPDQKLDNDMTSPIKDFESELMKRDGLDEDMSYDYIELNSTANLGPDDTNKENTFAITPLEAAFFQADDTGDNGDNEAVTPKEEEAALIGIDAQIEQRKTRQNPNLSKTKTLISEHLDRLRTGFTREDVEGTAKPHHIHILDSPTADDPSESIYGIALIVAIGSALTVAVIGLAFGWYTLSKKAKAAADVDYPAYGVTGPNVDISGDKKLAQSAHMYHYQHQKQQIIAMERNDMDRNGSVSDPESEEENEEGDYTVYECPGFATTGDMEVKNPLFKEGATPGTPAAKSDEEKVKPKE
ncbi:uncharacterized protein LOC120636554 isoform X2 [Pararge aegeria]|uniref:uncharacterized protein LOC120636554 isoform X2 n=1 Tax=Pararge aegeria TaxID=116150 RepID=UPI0019D3183F|nr:uncharacterized protein LOC120636554 isoform X2 [Pararge aegeria]